MLYKKHVLNLTNFNCPLRIKLICFRRFEFLDFTKIIYNKSTERKNVQKFSQLRNNYAVSSFKSKENIQKKSMSKLTFFLEFILRMHPKTGVIEDLTSSM